MVFIQKPGRNLFWQNPEVDLWLLSIHNTFSSQGKPQECRFLPQDPARKLSFVAVEPAQGEPRIAGTESSPGSVEQRDLVAERT